MRLPLVEQPRALVGFVASLVLVAAIAFFGAQLLPSQSRVVSAAIDTTVPVSVRVEKRVVSATSSLQGVVASGKTMDVPLYIPDGTNSAVVVSVNVEPGKAIQSGSLIGVVSNRPIFLLVSPLPFFRSLSQGDYGADVLAFQQALTAAGYPVPATGMMNSATINAYKSFYKKVGATPPGWPGLVFVDPRELITVPAAGAVALSVAAKGDVLSDKAPLAELQLTPDCITARVDVLDQSKYNLGSHVNLVGSNGYAGTGVVTAMSGFQGPTTSIAISGFDVTIGFSGNPTSGEVPSVSTPITVSTQAAGSPSIAVPLIAIHQDATGSYVLDKTGAPRGHPRRADVIVKDSADGWAAIEVGAIKVNDELIVQ